ncbi:O-linked N-acetylglucosamine transferase family protein [Selenomonas sp. F0473]|uniref:O-linked N-acetylglucosamine transferase family protein n=1 Tax=Selenomonas sp. F0473 TaxID=999423 RepID=UPI0025CE6394|nr:hypothetical protein [Selenomonas sp. F0473]
MKKKGAKKHRGKSAAHRHNAPRKIRVGYLSDAFGSGAWRTFLPAFFLGADRKRFELYAYHTGPEGDTELFAKEAAAFRTLGAYTAREAAEIIRRDAIDLLVDLSADAPPPLIREIFAAHPARHLVSIAERRPAELADALPSVDGYADFVPLCYTPLDPPKNYVFRTPLLERGTATIGFVGRADETLREEIVALCCALFSSIPDVRLILPAEIGGVLTDADIERAAEMGTDAAELFLADEISYEELDIAIGIAADPAQICRTLEYAVPLLTAHPFAGGAYAAGILAAVEPDEEIAADTSALAARAGVLLRDAARLSELHELLRWNLHDSPLADSGAYMFTVERAYDRVLFGVKERPHVEEHEAALMRAETSKDWARVAYEARILDGCGALAPAGRMSLAWAYFFLNRKVLAARWALAAEGVPPEREGARLFLAIASGSLYCSQAELVALAQKGLSEIEAERLSVSPEVREALCKACADYGADVLGAAAAARYAEMYAACASDHLMRRSYYSTALMTMNAVDVPPAEICRRSVGYEQFFAGIRPYTHTGRRKKEKIRIGYISGDFREHVMQYFIWPFLAGFDRDSFEVYCYSLGKTDQYTEFFKTLVTAWRDVSADAAAPAKIAARIYADEVDILFDLAGHTARSGLPALAWKPAPVQVSGLGYMATTGLRAVDYFVTDRYCDPPGAGTDIYFVEKLLRLTSQFCYNGYTHLPASEGTPARRRGYIRFASFNQYVKITDEMLRVWAEILRRLPTARLLLKNAAYAKKGVVRAAHDRMKRLGLDMSRVQFERATRDYMLRYLDVDIALDTFPWPGGGTTCDALYMGVPVVSYYTERHSTRFTYSLLANIGLGDLASERLSDYVETAVMLAGNLDLLDALHRELRDRMKVSPMMDQERYIREMEGCYRDIWARRETEQGFV